VPICAPAARPCLSSWLRSLSAAVSLQLPAGSSKRQQTRCMRSDSSRAMTGLAAAPESPPPCLRRVLLCRGCHWHRSNAPGVHTPAVCGCCAGHHPGLGAAPHVLSRRSRSAATRLQAEQVQGGLFFYNHWLLLLALLFTGSGLRLLLGACWGPLESRPANIASTAAFLKQGICMFVSVRQPALGGRLCCKVVCLWCCAVCACLQARILGPTMLHTWSHSPPGM
jgi:hypothetical protein